ncbi:histidinol-phosphate aminotransferase [Evansella caseinilytica]|uniref:Histidinol-phosphate aminotransferase n=1 Tax=Evansella caseinilytica TaxID=1503961 RepID=A0A1H3NES0_9BACI|nr:histidinol-phosphate transaminase [Evansella caseinilytica]SDY87441.1 histidinol-phosphate aminotransferase [Evansella caseinilytica]
MKIKQTMSGLLPYQPGKPIEDVKREFGLEEVIKLASNENPYGCSPKVKEAIQQSFHELAVYPDGYARHLREAVAARFGVKETELIFGNGSDEVILILCRSFLTKEDNIVTASPTFPQYRHNAVIEGAKVKEVPLVDGMHDLEAMLEAIDANTKMVFVCNPNNPSGTYVGEEQFLAFLERVPEDVLVISDEAYYEYVAAEDYPETLPLIKRYPNLIVLRTFSKAYGLASLRVGYGVAAAEVIKAVDPGREPFNTNTLAQRAAVAALEDQDFVSACHLKNRTEMERFERFCQETGLSYYPSQTNFILIHFNRPGGEVFHYLLTNGFITRNGEALGFPDAVRITLGTREQNEKLIEALSKLV